MQWHQTTAFLAVLALPTLALTQDGWPDRTTLPIELAPFGGEIGQTLAL